MATTVRTEGCVLVVTVRIEFLNRTTTFNSAQFPLLIDEWEREIARIWNGPEGQQRFEGCTVHFEIVTRIGRRTDGYHQIEVQDSRRQPISRTIVDTKTTSGSWRAGPPAEAAHEVGHLMGLPDEYEYVGPERAYQPTGQPNSLMARTWDQPVVLQSHVVAIMQRLGGLCPPECSGG